MNYKAPIDIAERLKAYRLSRQWTLKQMADLTGMTASAIHKIENGDVTPTELTMSKFMRTLPGLIDDAA